MRLLSLWAGLTFGIGAAFAVEAGGNGTAAAARYADKLAGTWGGLRAALFTHGIEFEVTNTVDFIANTGGGVEDLATLSNLLELELTVDMATLANLPGGTLYVMGLGTHGRDAGQATGSINAPSSLAAEDAFRVYEAWYEQSLLDGRIGLLIGIYGVDSEFDSKDTANVFVNGGFGTGLDLSETGVNGPSIFPVTSFGGRLRVSLTNQITLRVAVLDGVPGDPGDATATTVRLASGDGLLIMSEINYEPRGFTFLRYALGSWAYSTDFDDLLDHVPSTGRPVRHDGSYGVYGFVEGKLFSEKADPDQGLAAYLRVGDADEDVNQIGSYIGGGLVYTGLLPGRNGDVIGAGFSIGINGDSFKAARARAAESVTGAEAVIEITYRAQVLPWLAVQPVMQYYADPGSDPGLDDTLAGGIRITVDF